MMGLTFRECYPSFLVATSWLHRNLPRLQLSRRCRRARGDHRRQIVSVG